MPKDALVPTYNDLSKIKETGSDINDTVEFDCSKNLSQGQNKNDNTQPAKVLHGIWN